MKIIDHVISCRSRRDRIEIFPFFDCHIGKRNCAEKAIKKQVQEILRRSKLPNRHVRVVFGGDQIDAISPADLQRFDFNELADWFVESNAETTRERLGDIVNQEVEHAVSLFKPVRDYTIGALLGNHERTMRTKQNVNAHAAFCDRLGVTNLTDQAMIRLRMRRPLGGTTAVSIYLRHGYGAGRTAGAEPNKIERMMAEWEGADVCLTGHTHTFCIAPPKPVLYLPTKGNLPGQMLQRYRFGANCGCWLLSHIPGVGSYESAKCYPARPMMTLKVVIWPFWATKIQGQSVERPKIELRQYPIL